MLLLAFAAVAASSAPPVVPLTAADTLAALNGAWTRSGEPRFEPMPDTRTQALHACSAPALCLVLTGSPERVSAITLTGPARDRRASTRYLAAQSLLVRLTAPGAPVLPAVTADRIAVTGVSPAEAQLGSTCMRVQRSTAGELATTFARRRCSMDPTPSP